MPNKFYLTTPIYYVNARPHIGHAYTTIVADVLARRHRLLGDDTWFLTGTDEHGQKIERSALAAGIPPQQFTDEVSASFRTLWDRMGLTYDQYIRTTDEAHHRGVQKLFATLYERGAIYLDSYTGAYCVSDEAFVDAPVGTPCPDCGRLLEQVTEENFFFRLSDYQLPLLNLIESNELLITPDSRRNEVLSFLRGPVPSKDAVILSEAQSAESKNPEAASPADTASPFSTTTAHTALGTPYIPGALKDLSVSRSSFTWGIPVPEPAASEAKEKHVIYVWLDALANYMTAVGYGSDDPVDIEKFAKYWPADLHLVGKEIIRFHCVYWPAFLLALNPKLQHKPDEPTPILSPEEHKAWAVKWLPKAITAHGWLLFDDSKMSKSKGNIVRTETILDAFGTLCPAPASSPSSPSSPSLLSSRSAAEGSAVEAPQPPLSLSSRSEAEGSASPPEEATSSPPTHTVILSEASASSALSEASASSALAQSKNPEEASATSTAETLSTTTASLRGTSLSQPFTLPTGTTLKGTPSGVPSPTHNEAAPSAAGGISGPAQTPVILSEAQSAESKNPEEARPTSTAENLSTTTASLRGTSLSEPLTLPTGKTLKGTPSGVPQTAQKDSRSGALAPEPTKAQRDLFAADILRYFLLREIPFGQDGSFSFEALITRYNADLANGYGNLVSRTLKLVEQNFPEGWVVPTQPWLYPEPAESTATDAEVQKSTFTVADLSTDCVEIPDEVWWPQNNFQQLLTQVMSLVGTVDVYLSLHKPWTLAKSSAEEDRKRLIEVLYTAAESIRIITLLLHPILPYATTRVWQQLGLDRAELTTNNEQRTTLAWGGLKPGTKLGPLSPIFPRADKGLAQIMADAELPKITDNNDATHPPQDDLKTAPIASEAPKSKLVDESFIQTPPPAQTFDPAAGPRTTTLAEPDAHTHVAGSGAVTTERTPPPSTDPLSSYNALQISIDDFIKIDLRVAKIVVAERIPKADKLLRLEVDLGYETRQILSGIAEYYTPEELVGKRIVIIANLAPRKMRGLESHGMLLAASAEGGKPILATFPESEELPLGSRLK